MTRRYTAEEAHALIRRNECWERGHHVTGLRAAPGFFVPPSPFELPWESEDLECMHCDARMTVAYPGPLGIEVEE